MSQCLISWRCYKQTRRIAKTPHFVEVDVKVDIPISIEKNPTSNVRQIARKNSVGSKLGFLWNNDEYSGQKWGNFWNPSFSDETFTLDWLHI